MAVSPSPDDTKTHPMMRPIDVPAAPDPVTGKHRRLLGSRIFPARAHPRQFRTQHALAPIRTLAQAMSAKAMSAAIGDSGITADAPGTPLATAIIEAPIGGTQPGHPLGASSGVVRPIEPVATRSTTPAIYPWLDRLPRHDFDIGDVMRDSAGESPAP
jgi:hypothetical protein